MKNLFIFPLIIGLFILSCTTANNPTYQLTTTVSPSEGGTISPSSGTYSEGEVVSLTATPSTGWRFVRWEGDWSGTANPVNIGMNRNFNVVGIFEKRNYPLTINIDGYGEVEERVIQQKTTEYPYQTIVELTPVPYKGWRFLEWIGDLSGNEVPKQIIVDGDKTVTAKFQRKDYPLTINIVGQGTVKETVLPQRTTQYPFETAVILESIPSDGWEFVSWSGDLSGEENPQLIVVDGDKTVTATFQLKTYPINLGYEGEGTVQIEPQQEVYQHGSTVTLTPNPSEGWEFVEWGGDLSGNTFPKELTVTSELNIIAVFGRKDYPLTVNVVGEGTVEERIIPQRTTQYPFETVVELTPVPSDGWVFHQWSGDLSGNQNPITIEVNESKTVTSEFKSINELLTIEIVGEGTVEIEQESFESNPARRIITLTPKPSEGWRFVSWSGDLTGREVPKQIIADRVKTVTAIFERRNYPLTINIIGEGTVKETVLPQRTTQYPFETLVELTPNPTEGWEFVEWGGDLSGNENPKQIIVDGAISVTAKFVLKTYSLNLTLVGNVIVTIEPERNLYTHGQSITLTARPTYSDTETWIFSGWSGDFTSAENPLIFEITSEKNITATFEKYTLKEDEVYNRATGRVWMDKNLGASRVAVSPTDSESFGDLYQWGRSSDGHENRNSTTTNILSPTNTPSHGSFIIVSSGNYDWRNPQNNNLWQGVNGINNPCPIDYRIPTISEWKTELQSWSSNDITGAFNSSLKLPLGGIRNWNNGVLNDEQVRGYYWSSSSANYRVQYMYFDHSIVNTDNSIRANGMSVRCIKD